MAGAVETGASAELSVDHGEADFGPTPPSVREWRNLTEPVSKVLSREGLPAGGHTRPELAAWQLV